MPTEVPTTTERLSPPTTPAEPYEYEETREIVALVRDAAELVRARGESAFDELRKPGSRWRQGETYVFVLDAEGVTVVHPDPSMEGQNQLDLTDIHGKPIIRGLIDAVTSIPGKMEGWYHYEWPVPGGLLPRWKSTYLRLVEAPSGKRYVVACGVYNDRMEKAFVIDIVKGAAGQIERRGQAALAAIRDPSGPFVAKDAYVFIMDMNGNELFNAAFPTLEGRNLWDLADARGNRMVQDMIGVVKSRGSGWVQYMWPKPGESIPTQKSVYVQKGVLGDRPVVVACGVYLADAPKEARPAPKITPAELVALVREAAVLLEKEGENAYAELRKEGTKWHHDDLYFLVWTIDGIRTLHVAHPETEGEDSRELTDVIGRPIGRMLLSVRSTPSGEGWGHYMYPRPGDIFPT